MIYVIYNRPSLQGRRTISILQIISLYLIDRKTPVVIKLLLLCLLVLNLTNLKGRRFIFFNSPIDYELYSSSCWDLHKGLSYLPRFHDILMVSWMAV